MSFHNLQIKLQLIHRCARKNLQEAPTTACSHLKLSYTLLRTLSLSLSAAIDMVVASGLQFSESNIRFSPFLNTGNKNTNPTVHFKTLELL